MDCMRDNFVEGVLLDGRFQTVSPLNHGSFGMVFRAVDTWTGETVALKCLTKPSAAATCAHVLAVDDRSEELVIHRQIDHPNIVNLVHHFETEHHVYLVLEFCPNGDLYEAIRIGTGPGQTENIRECMLQLVGAIEHMHARNIFHRDIKPENIFLAQDGTMKLGDFGLATMDTWSYESSVGSDRYMAPEQYDHMNVGYSPAMADVWAIGICLLNILFSRNPFATPTLADPLFSDFANDRQTLFDVFPNMSQDTFEILMHCLAIDPTKRSLAEVRAAIERAVSFTTDEESLDDFCAEDTVVVTARANREPLRTPSISVPAFDPSGAFPWAKALAMSPPPARQLSAIPDTEDLFPASQKSVVNWFSLKPEPSSVASFVDSGLGLSFKSSNGQVEPLKFTRSKPVPISGSLPVSMSRPIPSMSAVFGGKKRELVSKSWSDLWDEDEEAQAEAEHSDVEHDFHLDLEDSPRNARVAESDGSDTPRAVLAEVNATSVVNNSRNFSSDGAQDIDHRVSEHTGFLFEDLHEPISPTSPSKSTPLKRNTLDRWAALGELRRGMPTPTSRKSTPAAPVVSIGIRDETPRRRSRARSWRRNAHHPSNSAQAISTPTPNSTSKEWNMSKDWRQHSSPVQPQPKQPYQNNHHHQPLPKGLGLPRHCHGDVKDFEWVWRTETPPPVGY